MQLTFILFPAFKVVTDDKPIYIEFAKLFPEAYQLYVKEENIGNYLSYLVIEKDKENIAKSLIKVLKNPMMGQATIFKPSVPYETFQKEVDEFIAKTDIGKDIVPLIKNSEYGDIPESNIIKGSFVMVADYHVAFGETDFSLFDEHSSLQKTVDRLNEMATSFMDSHQLPDVKDQVLNDKDFLENLLRSSIDKIA